MYRIRQKELRIWRICWAVCGGAKAAKDVWIASSVRVTSFLDEYIRNGSSVITTLEAFHIQFDLDHHDCFWSGKLFKMVITP